MNEIEPQERQRLDKWLWYVRAVKSRSLAQKMIKSGKVRVNSERTKSSSLMLQLGDVLTFAQPRGVRVLKVLGTGTRRGPAVEAAVLYEDLSPPPIPLTAEERATKGRQPAPEKRPDKRARRNLIELKLTGENESI